MKKLLVSLIGCAALIALAQTNVVLKPGINVLATGPAHFPLVTGTNDGAAVTITGYDTADMSQFSLQTNAIDIVPIGAPFPPPRVVTTLKPAIRPTTFPAHSIARLMEHDWSNGCVVVVSGSNAHAITTSIVISNAP